MRISSLEVPKYRELNKGGDDTVLLLPELVGVFDGATSAPSAKTTISPGKLASKAAATTVANLYTSTNLSEMSLQEVCDEIQRAIVARSADHDEGIKPSTTMAVAMLEEHEVRLLLVGDSGIRINGKDIYQPLKKIDDVSTDARIAIFNLLKKTSANYDRLEYLCREIIFLGLDQAVTNGHLSQEDADSIIEDTTATGYSAEEIRVAKDFLRGGIKTQHIFANRADVPFGYSTLSKEKFAMIDAVDIRIPRKDVKTIEVFSDGYFSMPKTGVSVSDWEREFQTTEDKDFSKISECKSIKGSTASEFADDRSLIVVELSALEESHA